jgi:signal transduction histidine kinase/integral membrane sensor domain MASE1/ActR/RegA family two-component response regulator
LHRSLIRKEVNYHHEVARMIEAIPRVSASGGDLRRGLIAGACVAATYVVAARLGFTVAFVAPQITTVWAPTGIALAALLLRGRRLWPAVWLGAFVANAGTEAPLWTAVIIATGNTLEAVAAASFFGRSRGFDPGLRRLADTARYIAFAAMLSTLISATIGVTTLCLAGVQSWPRFPRLWSAWWLGDALATLVVAPVILATVRSSRRYSWQDWTGVALLTVATAVATEVVFGQPSGPIFGHGPLHYLIFPLAVVAAVRFGQPAAAMLVFSASAVSIWHTVRGDGPFASPDIYQGLILLQVFIAVLAGTGLLLAAAMTERQTSQRRRAAAYAVGEVLADAPDLANAAPAILRNVCENLAWQGGALWLVDAGDRLLRCVSVWNDGAMPVADFIRTTEATTFQPAVGLPGRVWATGRAVWIENVLQDRNFPRGTAARAAGIHGAFGFPIRLEGDVLGVVEFFTDRVATPDSELLDTMSTVGNQIGQFVGRKRTEMASRVSEERFRSLAASTSALTLYEQDRDLRYLWVFPQHPEFPNQNIGKTDADLLPSAEGERLSAMKRAVLQSGVGRREEVTVTLPTETRSYDLMIEPRKDSSGAITGISGVAVDITERKRSEQLLVEHRNVLELIVSGHSADECLSSVSEAVSRLSAHAGACVLIADGEQHGFAIRHGVPVQPSFVDALMSPPMNMAVAERVFRSTAPISIDIERDEHWPSAFRELCLSHGIHACHLEPALNTAGIAVGWIMLCLDDARAVSAWELRVAQFGAHIASIVIERERAEQTIRASEERLKDADRRKDEFLAMLAHELRNPLAPIRTGLQLVKLAGDTPGAVERIRPMMERQIGHMVRLIDDLLDVSRITSGKIQLKQQAASLAEVIDGAVEANRAAIDAARLQLSIQLPAAPPLLFVDPTRFIQVISNLLNNAAKFTGAGGQINITGAVVGDSAGGDEVVLRVSDTGIGIPGELLPRVFDLFTQGERPAHRPQPGLGIGLALARRIVEMHGGRIEARSAGPGGGSEFTIYMPALGAVGTAQENPPEAVARAALKRRVLIVDDNADAADTLASLVRTLGGEARTAADGPGGIQCASEFSPDVILLDIGMPGMDGYEACRRLRLAQLDNRAFIVAISGWGQDGDKRRAAEAGFDAHLTKPADPAVLERLLAQAAATDHEPRQPTSR